MNKAGKEAVVADVKRRFKEAKVAILTDFRGLNAGQITDLRRELRSGGVEFFVVKNTLAKLAVADTDFVGLKEKFDGPIAIALAGEDVIAPAKLLTSFIKENETLEIKVGMLEGELLNVNQIEELAKLPSKDVLIGQLMSLMMGPVTNLACLLNEIPRRLVSAIDEIRKQKE